MVHPNDGIAIVDFLGKGSVVGAIGIKTLAFIGLAQANGIGTLILTIAGICYTAFRTWNEIQKIIDKRKASKAGAGTAINQEEKE